MGCSPPPITEKEPPIAFLSRIGLSVEGRGGILPRRPWAIWGDISDCHNLKEPYCNLVGRGQTCSSTSYNAQDGPQSRCGGPNVHGDKVENASLENVSHGDWPW